MATLHEAQSAQAKAWSEVQTRLRVRPSVIGLIRVDDGFGLAITLPFAPQVEPPGDLLGVPVRFSVAVGQPELAAAPRPKWMDVVAPRRR